MQKVFCRLMAKRPTVSPFLFNLLAALFMVFVLNRTFWEKTWAYLDGDLSAFVALFIGATALFLAIFSLSSYPWLSKPVAIFLFLSASAASFYIDNFGVIISRDMIQNAVQTTWPEARHLITPDLALHALLTGVLPVLAILFVRIEQRPFLSATLWNGVSVALCVAAFLAAGLSHYRTYPSLFRGHKDLVRYFNPVAPIASTARYFAGVKAKGPIQPLGRDAVVVASSSSDKKPRIAVLVVGETARSANFSLQGYGRETNPEMKKQDIVYFSAVTSCGTATAVSLPCMFSIFPKRDYSQSKFDELETLPDVLAHAGLDVMWWENNTGSKGVADRVPWVQIQSLNDPAWCEGGECKDGMMLPMVDEWLDKATKDGVLIVHQMGSHGPAYYQRYPEEFRRFKTDCRTAQLDACKPEEIVNAYDNTVLYTDYFVAEIIKKLKARSDRLASAMFYVSDHGESLGENGLYLHGMPYGIAPKVQYEIPMVYWSDKAFDETMDLDKECLIARAAEPLSHDNYFHSVLGMMNVKTEIYDRSLDMFSVCRKKELL